MKAVHLSRMSVIRNGAPVSTRVLNDALFCHRSPAATTRYILKLGKLVEEQKSSGFWIGPAAGSTAAQRSAGGKILPLASTDLQLVVINGQSQWSAPKGIKLGTSLAALEKANGRPFKIGGFGDDGSSSVLGWEGGAPAKEMCCGMKLVRKK